MATEADQGPEYQVQRSRNGCLTCRSRRVKCDEQRPVCNRCRAGQRECGWGAEKPPNPRRRKRKLVHAESSGRSTDWSPAENGPAPLPRAEEKPYANDQHQQPQHLLQQHGQQHLQHRSQQSQHSIAGAPTPPLPAALALGDIDWVSHDTRKRLMMDPTMLQAFFPKSDEMLTFRHYISTAEELIAFNPPKNPFNPWVSIHAPLALKDAPSSSLTSDAVRCAILGVGAVRLRYLDDPTNQRGAARLTTTVKERVMRLLAPILRDPESQPIRDIEGALAAMLSCIVGCTLAADNGWEDILDEAVRLIDRLGGAQKLVTMATKNQYNITRFVLEQLAVRDVVACMTLGRRPSIIRQPFEPWFFEIERWSDKEVEWESVERLFGVTRGMVDVMARACSLIGTARESMSMRSVGDLRAPPLHLQDAANGILAELQVLDHGFNYSPHHQRAQYGNHCYRHAMRIALMRDVLELDQTDERVQSCASAIFELARELDFEEGPTMNWLLWPLLLAGFHLGEDQREPLLRLLNHPGPQMCFDTRAGIRMLQDYWAQQDAGAAVSHWQILNNDLHRCLFAG